MIDGKKRKILFHPAKPAAPAQKQPEEKRDGKNGRVYVRGYVTQHQADGGNSQH